MNKIDDMELMKKIKEQVLEEYLQELDYQLAQVDQLLLQQDLKIKKMRMKTTKMMTNMIMKMQIIKTIINKTLIKDSDFYE